MTLPYPDEPDQRFWDKVVSWVSAAPPAPEEPPRPATHLLILLDRSGSMETLRDDTIGGFNAFLDQQKAIAGSAMLTLVQFDGQNPYEVMYADQPLDAAPPLTRATFVPRAGTPLLDALGQCVLDLEQRRANRPAEAPPAQVVAIITDGQENASRRFRKAQIVAMIEEKQAMGWQFVFLSADLDAVQDARQLGFREDTVMAFGRDARGMTEAWTRLSTSVTAYRAGDRPHLSLCHGPEPALPRVFPSAEAALDAVHDAQRPGLREQPAALQLRYRTHRLTLEPSETVFHMGRQAGNDLVIDDPRVSRRHLQLTFIDGQWVLQDSSTNGTYLWPEASDRQKVHHQTVIVRGRGVMVLGQAPSAENPDVIHYERVEAEADRDAGSATSPDRKSPGAED